MKKITMLDIANEMNVSRSTVSRAINCEPVVPEEIAFKIRSKAKKMGYKFKKTRNSVSDSLKPKMVLVISPLWPNVYTTLTASLTSGLIKKGFIPEFTDQKKVNPEGLKNFCGVILLHAPETKVINILKGKACVQVLGEPHPEQDEIDIITYDNKMSGILAADWLYSQKCRHLIGLMPEGFLGDIRGESFYNRAKELGCQAAIKKIKNPFLQQSEISFKDIIATNPNIDGLFVFNDYFTLSYYPQILSAGLKINQDIHIIGCDAQPFIYSLNPRPATIDLHMGQIGKRAVEVLEWRLQNPKDQPATLMLRPEIIKPEDLTFPELINVNNNMLAI